MVPSAVLRHPEIRSEQAAWRIPHGRIDSNSVRGAVARYQPGPFRPLQTGLPGVFLDLGGRLRTAHLCGWKTVGGDLAVPEPNRSCVLFPAFPGGAAARRQVRTPAAPPV